MGKCCPAPIPSASAITQQDMVSVFRWALEAFLYNSRLLQNRFHGRSRVAEQEESQWLAKCKNIWMHLLIHLLTKSFNI